MRAAKSQQEDYDQVKEQVSRLRKGGKKALDDLKKKYFARTMEDYDEELRAGYEDTMYLTGLLKEFEEIFREMKADRNMVDFDDVMHYACLLYTSAIGVWVYQAFGYHAAFCVALAFAIATGLTIQFISDKGEPMTSVQPEASRAEVLEPVGRKKLELVDRRVLPITAIIMLFAIPYCATQSFIVSYTETRDIAVSVGLFFPIYAIILLVLRMVMKGSFDRLPFKVFLIGSSVCAFCGIGLLAVMENNVLMFLAAAFMAGGYGIMCSVCQSTAILLARRGKRGLANSTYYIGLDMGMTLGPVIGGFLYGHLDISMFYPMLAVTVPLIIIVYIFSRKGLEPKNF